MLKTIVSSLSVLVFSSSAFAATYVCKGVDTSSGSNDEVAFALDVNATQVSLVDPDGDDINLDRQMRRNESTRSFAVYADNEYDGYGGFIKISVPQNVAAASQPVATSFTAYYEMDTYSELGKVGEVRVKGKCALSE